MTATQVNIGLAILLLVVLGLIAGADSDPTQPNWQLFKAMKHSPASKAFEANTQLPNRRTQQPLVAGTIPRGELPLHFAATREDALRAGDELLNPIRVAMEQAAAEPPPGAAPAKGESPTNVAPQSQASATPVAHPAETAMKASQTRGAEFFRVHCAACHGAAGAGDGQVAQRGFPPPPPLPTGKSAQMKDGQLFHILTYGQGSMSPLASQLSRGERWDLINFVRTLQANLGKPAEAAPPQQEPRP